MTRAPFLLSLATLVAVGTITTATPRQPDGKAEIEGVWRFQDEVDRRGDGSITPTGPALGYDGLLIFTANGYMSSTLMPKGRKWKFETVSSTELRETFAGASAHAGRYVVEPTTQTINMENIISLDPTEEGTWVPIRYVVKQDTLSLSGPWTYHGEKLTFTLHLARVK